MNLFEFLRDQRRNPNDKLSRQRLLPSQPEGTTPDRVFAGSDIGEVHYTGDKPEAGDFTVIVGQAPRAVALSSQTPGLAAPLFNNPCKCKCGSGAGTIFWANPIHTGPYLVIMDGNGSFLQTLNPPQLYRIAGLAVDSAPPHNLYVLDDRTRLNNFVTDGSPLTQVPGISTYVLHTFANSGTAYAWASAVELPDPGLPALPFFIEEMEWVTEGAANQMLADPPATYPTNCMAVIDGLLLITMSMAPARYRVWDGSSFAVHTLSLGGSCVPKGLRGQIVTGIARPGKSASRFVIAWQEGGNGEPGSGGFELIEFDNNDQIINHITDDTNLTSPTALLLMCNRVLALSSGSYGRTEDGGAGGLAGTAMLGTGGPPPIIPNGLLLDDLCRTRTLTRISKQQLFSGPLQGVTGAAVAGLGCEPVISHFQSPTNQSVLSRIGKTGAYVHALLTSANPGDRGNPGPTSHVYAVPGGNLISAATTNPFPVPSGSFSATYSFGADEWFTESGGGAQPVDESAHDYFGFGGATAPYWTLDIPPGRIFSGVPTGRLENHTYDNYWRLPVVSFATEPLTLNWQSASSWYAWSVRSPQLQIVTNKIGGGGTGQQWTLILFWQEVHPALLSSSGPTLSAALAGDGNQNGAGLHRSYCYAPLQSGVVMPNFGASASRSYAIGTGSLRSPLVLYTNSVADPSSPILISAAPSSYTLTFESVGGTPASISLPSPVRNPFDTSLTPSFTTWDQATTFTIPTRTVHNLIGEGNRVALAFDLEISGGFSATGFLEYVADPLVGQSVWNDCPRYYEMVALWQFRSNLP